MLRFAPIAATDPAAVETLLDAAFGPDRRGRTAYRLRSGVAAIPALSFAAFEGERLVGTLQSWPVELAEEDGRATPLVLVGPVAVDPACQRGGVGKALMRLLLDAADASGAPPMVLIGDPEYYDRFFGFTADATGAWAVPGPVERRRLLARAPGGVALPRHGMLRARQAEPVG